MNTRAILLAAGFAGGAIVLAQVNVAGAGGPSIGPDVIVGSIPNYTNYSASGGIDAYAIGTTSCNIGDTPLDWYANDTRHPVIGQNMFRLKDGRFEQIGQSFLKHGFTALNGSLCDTCNPTPGTSLGVGCSDPYSSGLNGNRTYLGPKYEVNATTGVFEYPFDPIPYNGQIAKRLQVAQVDVQSASNPGAVYWVEGQYVHPQDAAIHGQSTNNVSYRRISLSTFGDIVGFVGATVQELPALYGWQDEDPEVIIQRVRVQSDGNYFVGTRAYDNGDGTWDYEYAVQNYDSHASAGGFVVPVGAGVDVTNLGFHDVDYHSGEPWDDSDWTMQRDTTEVRWFTDTFTTNQDANAIRWGTVYNFRFTADQPPVLGPAVIDLFRPHTPSTVTVTVMQPGCRSDVNGDGTVGVLDLLAILAAWGPAAGAIPEDINMDGVVDVFDLLAVLGDWGDC